MKFNSNDWSNDFNYDDFETKSNNENILSEAHEALNRFYQKESKRSKTTKQKKHCWQ